MAEKRKIALETGSYQIQGVPLPRPTSNSAVAGFVIVAGDRNIAVGQDLAVKEIPRSQIDAESKKTISAEQAFERIAGAEQFYLSEMKNNLQQARDESLRWSWLTGILAGLGFAVLICGVFLVYFGQVSTAILATIAGLVSEAAAGLLFAKDRELRKTIEGYHSQIHSSQTLSTAINVAETMKNPAEQDKAKREIIFATLGVPNNSSKIQ
jgi:hypothetical protein